MKIKKGDTVKIISGKDKGKTGKVALVISDTQRIIVEGANMRKKHVKPRKQGQKGQTLEVAGSMHVSNAMFSCPSCGKATRLGAKKDGRKKYRVCVKCKAQI
ncbi:TPA: 50S ribosomal protein L24 [Patescibacteria group bacterium]|nr:MAG: Ribosomal protein L24 [Parcubacteria group bacterium GW2011_GWF2_40_10]KKR47415.1 MAG: Ribosomal protein L24 [Parcubacteria group bacterium GW2011_GWA2_40_143]KKR59815.1 MAG: Ribosomal protein L24 [Parcubacteria group bacterium GW2011_GWC2_40_31]KKR74408.1 MAG: Ribosomal protein L24 [Parcubacteria group bacterium GW2011_GWB2_40_8]KKR77195.1 MAG: Ribosomal protein L24 [Parcubacteria group bacterium GW2011_GWE2_40_8]KKR80810.1 MAG: Ribosomal protein L24 [Parcubacteria group bacterium GW2